MHPSLRATARLSALAAGLSVAVTGVAAAHTVPRSDRHHRIR